MNRLSNYNLLFLSFVTGRCHLAPEITRKILIAVGSPTAVITVERHSKSPANLSDTYASTQVSCTHEKMISSSHHSDRKALTRTMPGFCLYCTRAGGGGGRKVNQQKLARSKMCASKLFLRIKKCDMQSMYGHCRVSTRTFVAVDAVSRQHVRRCEKNFQANDRS